MFVPKKIFLLPTLLAASLLTAGTAVGMKDLTCHDGATLRDGVLLLDGKSGYASVRGGGNISIGKAGLTAAMSVKLADNGRKDTLPEGIDMLAAKRNVWLLGRHAGRIYTNFHDGKKWCGPLNPPWKYKPGKWYHVAAVFEPYDEKSEGEVGCISTIYIDGKAVAQKRFPHRLPAANGNGIRVGHLEGWSKNWLARGEIADFHLEDRALNPAEIESLAAKSTKVKIAGLRPLIPELQQAKADTPENRWAVEVLRAVPRETAAALAKEFGHDLYKNLQRERKNIQIVSLGDLKAAVNWGKGSFHPILGLYDARARRAVAVKSPFHWCAELRKGKIAKNASSETIRCAQVTREKDGLRVLWKSASPIPFTAESRIVFGKNRMEADLAFQPLDPGTVTDFVNFPCASFERADRDDKLLYPFQCGVLVDDPTEKRFVFGQNGWYPSLKATMQFDAYFSGRRGIYLGMEDPEAKLKEHHAVGQSGRLGLRWRHPAALPRKTSGSNKFVSPGKAALELYDGEWFEGAMIYRRFLEEARVPWFCRELPRSDTPQWYRDMTLNIHFNTWNRQMAEEAFRETAYLREYFELPINARWSFDWFDVAKGCWPVFRMYDWGPPLLKRYANAGFYLHLYLDYYLWKHLDGPKGKSDLRYSTHGRRFEVRRFDNTPPTHFYKVGAHAGYHSVMCPGAAGWRENSRQLIRDTIRDYGPQGIYHDQVACCTGYPCYAADHGHALNDPAVWIKGYRELLMSVRKEFPQIPHDSEDMSEPYVEMFDGAGVWRWTLPGQVPAFNAIYSGRIQFVGRMMDQHFKGDPRSFFIKLAYELIYAEQLGFFNPSELWRADFRRLYLKRLMHLRKLLLPYFNTGRMLPPVRFRTAVPEITTQWGSYYPRPISLIATPKLLANSYLAPLGTCWIFINPLDEKQSAEPVLDGGTETVWRCLAGAAKPVPRKSGDKVELAPYAFEVWVTDEAEAARIQKGLNAIARMTDQGKSFDKLFAFSAPGRILKIEPLEIIGPEKSAGHYRCSIAEPNKFFGWFAPGAVVYYGRVDLGAKPVTEITLRAGVNPKYAGAKVEFITGREGDDVAGSTTLTSTGAFGNYRNFRIKLEKPLSGVQEVRVRFHGNSCCNFIGWAAGRAPDPAGE